MFQDLLFEFIDKRIIGVAYTHFTDHHQLYVFFSLFSSACTS